MSPDTRDIRVLDTIAEAMAHEVPGLDWPSSSRPARRGVVWQPLYRLGLGRRGGFGWFSCHGLVPVDPRILLEMTSSLVGPSRVVQRSGAAAAHVEATWPWRLSADGQAHLLAAGLQWLLGRGVAAPLPDADGTGSRPWDSLMAGEGLTELPAAEGCRELRTGRPGRAAMQVTLRRPCPKALSISTFVANWTAEGDLAEQATARLVTLMNGRLRWVRLVLGDGAISAEVTLPADQFDEQTWGLAREAMAQASRSCRAALRLIQTPAVAAEFMRLHRPREASGKSAISTQAAEREAG